MATTINAGNATTGAAISADTTGILQLQSGSTPTTAVTIDTSQNVGIGTASPAAKLQVNSATDDIFRMVATAPYLSFYNGSTRMGYIRANTGNFGIVSEDASTPMTFYTNTNERMRIDSSGRVLVGLTATRSNGGQLQVSAIGQTGIVTYTNITTGNNAAYFENPNGIVGAITTSGSSTSYATSSDYRLKENIVPMTGALATVQALKPVTYKWKSDGSDGQGFIAHEIQEVVPDCVTGEKDAVDKNGNPEYQGIDTSFLVATLTAAIQELNAKVTALEAKLESK
jgi:hypothetical protein